MKKPVIILAFLVSVISVSAQQRLVIAVNDAKTKSPVISTLLLKGTRNGISTDSLGVSAIVFPSYGKYVLVTSAVGYREKEIQLTIPHSADTVHIQLEVEDEEMEEVIVQSTRTSRTIANVPTRVETIEFEEIDEKSNMRPGNVAMLLHESTGIQVQQTSATSGNASIRLQGLDGRYTQLLKDGFPNFGNFSSGLSVLEIPPLDLKQVEIIKGPASPLFGGGAIAGVVNFISKTPRAKPEYNFVVNHSSIGQSNIGGFGSQRGRTVGYTMLALYNRSNAYDVDDDDFTEVPKSEEFTFHPKIFIYANEQSTVSIGNSLTKGERTGGDIHVIKNVASTSHQYFEKNKTLRNISTLEFERKFGTSKTLIAKQSFSIFDRTIEIPDYKFAGINHNGYTDVSYLTNGERHSFVVGGNFIYDRFKEKDESAGERNSMSRTAGLYGQHTYDASDKVKLETGLRVDVLKYSNSGYSNTEAFVLPRVSVLVKYNSKVSSRIGAGIGYKTPTLFTEETETIQYRNVAQLEDVKSEKSYGATADVNFRTSISDDLQFTLNHMFFFTWINKPLVLQAVGAGNLIFANASKPVRSAGFETNARFIFRENSKLFLGYTFIDVRAKHLTGNQFLPLVPKSKLNTALIYEREGVIKLGLEAYFTGRQYLSDGSRTPAFSELGFMAEKIFKKISLFVNFENFTDARQSKYKNVVNGSHLDPTFDEIWNHTEGFVVNGGLKVRL